MRSRRRGGRRTSAVRSGALHPCAGQRQSHLRPREGPATVDLLNAEVAPAAGPRPPGAAACGVAAGAPRPPPRASASSSAPSTRGRSDRPTGETVVVLIAVVSDIHGNRHAFESVLDEIDASECEELWCLGDLVGYGAEPDACVELARRHAAICLAGNHDLGVCGIAATGGVLQGRRAGRPVDPTNDRRRRPASTCWDSSPATSRRRSASTTPAPATRCGNTSSLRSRPSCAWTASSIESA